jgi:hypothetical protein
MAEPDIRWSGRSGRNYGYWIYPIDAKFRKIAGNSVFAKKDANGKWIPIYVGQTRNFDAGLADRDGENLAKMSGATHVHVHFSSPDEPRRIKEVKDIVEQWKPECNLERRSLNRVR